MIVPLTKTTENQKILNLLSEIESTLYYRKDGSDPAQGVSENTIKATHYHIKKALEVWHKGTGLTID